jgi:outer membrane immunogenic protein
VDFDYFCAGGFTLAPVATIVANVETRFHDHALRIGLNYASAVR